MTTTQRQSNTVVARVHGHDVRDCASRGWDLTLYSDGSVGAEWVTCWQGEQCERWRSEPGTIDMDDVDALDPDRDAESHLTSLLHEIETTPDYFDLRPGWRLTRRGAPIR